MIAPEHRETARDVAAWLRGHAPYPDPEPDVLAALPGWDDYVADEISGVGFARRIEAALPTMTGARDCEVCGREAQAMGTEARCVEHCSERVM